MQKEKGLIWFTNNLRAIDNKVLYEASKRSDSLIGYYNFDPLLFKRNIWGFKKTEKYRTKFLIESIDNLKKNLSQLNITLVIDFSEGFNKLFEVIGREKISSIYFQKEWTSEEKETQDKIFNKISKKIKKLSFYDQFLFQPSDINIEIADFPEIFSIFRKKVEKKIEINNCFPVPKKYPKSNLLNIENETPNLEKLGFKSFKIDANSAFPFIGGTDNCLERINSYFWKSKKIEYYKQTRNGMIKTDYSSKLSSWLSNGSISARYIYWQIKDYEKKETKNQSTYWLFFELMWRDFFKYISIKHGNKIFNKNGLSKTQVNWINDQKELKNWINGTTDEPFINANMIELKKTGWMSNRGRQNISSFFSKNLKLDWRIGASYFESMLIDYDVHSNYGNWLYNSGIGNDPMPFRKFNVKFQSEKYDPKKKFENLWLNSQYELEL
mgnify:FL=1